MIILFPLLFLVSWVSYNTRTNNNQTGKTEFLVLSSETGMKRRSMNMAIFFTSCTYSSM